MRTYSTTALRRAAVGTVAGLLAAAGMPRVSDAVIVSWNAGGGGVWSGANWSGGVGSNPPTGADTANFAIAFSYNITLDVNPSINNMTVAGSNVTLLNGTVGRTLTNAFGVTVNSGSLTLNAAQPITLIANNNSSFNNNVSIFNGSDFSGTNLNIGTTQNGTTLVNGAGSTLNCAGGVTIGQGIAKTGTLTLQNGASGGSAAQTTMATLQSGTGILNILSGADWSAGGLTMSNNAVASQNSSATISGIGSTLTNAGAMSIGSGGTNSATMTISNSGAVSSSGVNFLSVGSSGLIDIQSGGTFTIFDQAAFVNSGGGSQGKILVNGTGSSFSQTGNVGVVVGGASGSLATIQTGSGGSFSTGTAGMTINAAGLVDIVGGTFSLNGNATVNGTLQRDLGGALNWAASKTMTVQNGGDVALTGGYTLPASATVNVTGAGSSFAAGGLLNVGSGAQIDISSDGQVTATQERLGDVGHGTITQSGGIHTVSGAINPLWMATTIGSTASYNLSGGTLNVINDFVGANGEAVGFSGTATFTQTGGTHTVSGANGNLVIGYAPTGVGTYTISNGNLTADSLYLGRDGGATGTLNVNAGAFVTVAEEFMDLGLNVGATGTVNANAGAIFTKGIFVGGISSEPRGTGVLNVAGGNVNANVLAGLANSGQLRVWDTPGSAINLSAGDLSCDTLITSGNPSRFNWTGGNLRITGAAGFSVSPAGPLGANLTLNNSMGLIVTKTTDIPSGSSLACVGTGAFLTGSLTGAGALSSDFSGMFVGFDNTSTTFTGTITGTGGLSKQGTGTLTVNNVRIRAVTIQNGTLAIAPNGGADGTSILSTLNILAPGVLDLADNDLIVDYTGPSVESAIRQYVIDGRITFTPGGGNTTIAVADNVEWGQSDLNGIPITDTTVVGKYTYFGDANLDGMVTSDDYVSVDVGIGVGDSWIEGDFDMDGLVTSDDYVAIDVNLGSGTGDPLAFAELKAEMVALHAAMFGEEYLAKVAAAEKYGFAAVPEPAGAASSVLFACGLLARRRDAS